MRLRELICSSRMLTCACAPAQLPFWTCCSTWARVARILVAEAGERSLEFELSPQPAREAQASTTRIAPRDSRVGRRLADIGFKTSFPNFTPSLSDFA